MAYLSIRRFFHHLSQVIFQTQLHSEANDTHQDGDIGQGAKKSCCYVISGFPYSFVGGAVLLTKSQAFGSPTTFPLARIRTLFLHVINPSLNPNPHSPHVIPRNFS
ncbi:hypothetical protein P3L10_019315 [Capsicum annuum]